jgi:hypothetical protein
MRDNEEEYLGSEDGGSYKTGRKLWLVRWNEINDSPLEAIDKLSDELRDWENKF